MARRLQALRDRFHRLRGEFILAAVSAAFGGVTVAAPRWVEAGAGVDIDRHSGVLEWAVTVVLLLVAVAAALSARRHYRRLCSRERTAEAIDCCGVQPPAGAKRNSVQSSETSS